MLSHMVLRRELRKWANKLGHAGGWLEPGTEICIQYLGTQRTKDGYPYEGYKVYARV